MARRRLLKSYFRVVYDDKKYSYGEAVNVSPFEYTGGSTSFIVQSNRAWKIGTSPDWFTLNPTEGKKGETTVIVTAPQNQTTSPKESTATAGFKCFVSLLGGNARNVQLDLEQKAGVTPTLLIQGETNHSTTTSSDAKDMTFSLFQAYLKTSTIGYYYGQGEQGNITNVTLAPSDEEMTVTMAANSDTASPATSIVHVSGESVYGTTLVATLTIQQAKAEPVIPTYQVTFVCMDCDAGQAVTAHTLSYKINDGSWVTVPTPRTGFTVTVQENDIVYYQGTLTGYESVNDSETMDGSTTRYNVCFAEIVVNPYFEIVSAVGQSTITGYYENELMPNGAVLLHSDSRSPVVTYRTNISGVIPVFSYPSGSTGWISGITENEALTPPTGDSKTFVLTNNSNINTTVFNVAKITFKNRNTNAVVGELPIMTTVDERKENDYVYLSKSSAGTPDESDLEYNVGAREADVHVWMRSNTTVKGSYTPGLTFYDGLTGEQLINPETPGSEYNGPLVVFPTEVLGNKTYTTTANPWFHLVIRVPANGDLSSGKTYSIRFETEYYDEMDLSWKDHATIEISQAKNSYRYSNFYIREFLFDDCDWEDEEGEVITIDSSARTYSYNGADGSWKPHVEIMATRSDVAGTITPSEVLYMDYLLNMTDGLGVDTSKISISVPSWMSIVPDRSSGGQTGYTPSYDSPFALEVQANQSTANTGNDRTGNITLTWKYDNTVSKTVQVTQKWSKKAAPQLPMYVYVATNRGGSGKASQIEENSNAYMDNGAKYVDFSLVYAGNGTPKYGFDTDGYYGDLIHDDSIDLFESQYTWEDGRNSIDFTVRLLTEEHDNFEIKVECWLENVNPQPTATLKINVSNL